MAFVRRQDGTDGYPTPAAWLAHHRVERARLAGDLVGQQAAKVELAAALQHRQWEPSEPPEHWRDTPGCNCHTVDLFDPITLAMLTPDEPWSPEAWGPDSIFSPEAEARRAERQASHRTEHTDQED